MTGMNLFEHGRITRNQTARSQKMSQLRDERGGGGGSVTHLSEKVEGVRQKNND